VAEPRCCAICGRWFRPDRRSRSHQRYGSRRCAKKAQRERLGWADYMRYWRKAKPEERAAQERERAHSYYERHREAILEKRRRQRAARKALPKARS